GSAANSWARSAAATVGAGSPLTSSMVQSIIPAPLGNGGALPLSLTVWRGVTLFQGLGALVLQKALKMVSGSPSRTRVVSPWEEGCRAIRVPVTSMTLLAYLAAAACRSFLNSAAISGAVTVKSALPRAGPGGGPTVMLQPRGSSSTAA